MRHALSQPLRLSLCVKLCLLGLTSPVAANESGSNRLEQINVVSTAAGFDQNINEAPASISVLTREDLQNRQYRDLAEALADVEGVDVRGGTGKTGGLDISIRGMPSDYTLILIDGRRQNVAGDVTPNGFGAAHTSFMPPLSAIERIEVVRGPMSTLYGSDAIGGVVNIITRKVSPEWGGSLRLESGIPQDTDWGVQQKADIYANGPLVDNLLGLVVRVGTYHREASEYVLAPGAAPTGRNPAPAETRQYSLGARFTLTPTDQHDLWLELDRGLTRYNNDDGRLGNRDAVVIDNEVGNLPGYKDTLRFNRDQVALGHTSRLPLGQLESSLAWSTTETLGRTIPGSFDDIGEPFSGFPGIIIGDDRELETTNTVFDTRYVAPIGNAHTATVGGQWWKAELSDGLLPEDHEQTLYALFIEDEWRLLDNLALTLGGRHDHHDAFGSHFSPRAYLVWGATHELTFKGGVSQGFKAPRLNQLIDGISGVTAQGATISIGNPNLKPETSTNTELAVLFDNYNGLAGSVTLFHNKIDDRISSGGDCATDFISSCNANPTATYSINIDEAKTWGAEVAGRAPLTDNVSMQLSYTWTDSEVIENGDKNGKLANTPEHRANASLNWRANDRTQLWVRGEYRGESRRFSGDPANLSGNNALIYDAVGDLKAYELFHLGGSYRASESVTLNANIFNLLDKDFRKFETYENTSGDQAWAAQYFQSAQSVTGGTLPGRTFWLAVNIDF